MTIFDTDILSDIPARRAAVLTRADAIPREEQAVPVVAAEEIVRGRLDAVRQASAGRGNLTLWDAYARLEKSLTQLGIVRLLPYTDAADALFRMWRAQKLRIGTNDLRIAAIAFAHGAKLVTRNRRDFEQVPGLDLEIWS